jgi:Domain of unknown function (DUF2019)
MTGGAGADAALLAQYRELAVEWDASRDNSDEANRIFKIHHALYKRLRETPSGKQAIVDLLDDPVTAVRLLAATHSLQWAPDRSQMVLQEIEQEDNPYALDAKWTLRSYRNGKLNLDW